MPPKKSTPDETTQTGVIRAVEEPELRREPPQPPTLPEVPPGNTTGKMDAISLEPGDTSATGEHDTTVEDTESPPSQSKGSA